MAQDTKTKIGWRKVTRKDWRGFVGVPVYADGSRATGIRYCVRERGDGWDCWVEVFMWDWSQGSVTNIVFGCPNGAKTACEADWEEIGN